MSYNPKRDMLGELLLNDELTLQRIFTRMIFDTFVRAVVREHYGFFNPRHVTFQVDQDQAVLFVWEDGRAHMRDDDLLLEWAYDFIIEEVLDLDTSAVNIIYLDGAIDSAEPYLHISGDGVLIASGTPARKGKYLS